MSTRKEAWGHVQPRYRERKKKTKKKVCPSSNTKKNEPCIMPPLDIFERGLGAHVHEKPVWWIDRPGALNPIGASFSPPLV
jgi:hypothetical protein